MSILSLRRFSFFCKQGQHDRVFDALKEFGEPHQRPHNSHQGNGVMVSVELKEGVSKRFVDRFLFDLGITGANPRKNTYKVVKMKKWIDFWKIKEKVGVNTPFILSHGGKMKKMILVSREDCECCGPFEELQKLK